MNEDLIRALTDAQVYSWSPTQGYDGDCSAFAPEAIDKVIDVQVSRGDYAETEVRAVGLLGDGRYFFLAAGCDSTGWDCQSSCNVHFAASRQDIWTWAMTDEDRRNLPRVRDAIDELDESTRG